VSSVSLVKRGQGLIRERHGTWITDMENKQVKKKKKKQWGGGGLLEKEDLDHLPSDDVRGVQLAR